MCPSVLLVTSVHRQSYNTCKLDICVQTDHFIECNSHCSNSCNSSAFDEPHLFENSKENEVLSPIAIEDLEFIENQTVDSSLNDGENADTN